MTQQAYVSPWLRQEPRRLSEVLIERDILVHGGIERIDLLDAQESMRELLEEHLLPAKAGMPYPAEVIITGRLTTRQWARAMHISEFAAADVVPSDRRPADLLPGRSRRYLDIDWLRCPDLPGSCTRKAVCDLRAKAAGKTFVVQLIVDDLAPVA